MVQAIREFESHRFRQTCKTTHKGSFLLPFANAHMGRRNPIPASGHAADTSCGMLRVAFPAP
jgi:hypothetical protein